MSLQIAALLGQDGIINGAIYAMLALCIVLVFSVTRVLLVPLGEFLTFGALTMAALQAGRVPGVIWLLLALCWLAALLDVVERIRERHGALWPALVKLLYPIALWWLCRSIPLATVGLVAQAVLTLALLAPLGPLSYRLVFQPIAGAPSLVLLIAAMAMHTAMMGLGLLFFGAEGAKTTPFMEEDFSVYLKSQTVWVVGVSVLLIGALALFFEKTLRGKALRAAAMNRTGAVLMGISPTLAGKTCFLLAVSICVVSGILIAPMSTLYYDSGFALSLKGFVGSIIGGLVSYPVAAAGALLVGLVESYSTFYSSTYKEVLIFTLIVPVLLWRSLTTHHVEEEE